MKQMQIVSWVTSVATERFLIKVNISCILNMFTWMLQHTHTQSFENGNIHFIGVSK